MVTYYCSLSRDQPALGFHCQITTKIMTPVVTVLVQFNSNCHSSATSRKSHKEKKQVQLGDLVGLLHDRRFGAKTLRTRFGVAVGQLALFNLGVYKGGGGPWES